LRQNQRSSKRHSKIAKYSPYKISVAQDIQDLARHTRSRRA
jgi:hypothetical protein